MSPSDAPSTPTRAGATSAAERPPGSAHLAYTLGLACLGGGVAAFISKGSSRSLVAGSFLGAAHGWAGNLISAPGSQERGFRLATAASGVLTLAMGMRYLKTRALMPAGLLSVVGAASTAYHAQKWQEWAE